MRRLSSLVASLALASCAQGPGLVVEVGPLPPNATLLQPYLSLDGKPAKDIQPLDTRAGQSVQTFGLRLPTSVSAGQAAVDVLVLDQSGCALATGAADAAVAPEVRVKITLTALPTPRCDKKRPLLFSVTPPLGPTSGQTTVTVRGLGLLPSTAVKIGGAAAPLVAWRSDASDPLDALGGGKEPPDDMVLRVRDQQRPRPVRGQPVLDVVHPRVRHEHRPAELNQHRRLDHLHMPPEVPRVPPQVAEPPPPRPRLQHHRHRVPRHRLVLRPKDREQRRPHLRGRCRA